MNSNQRKIRVVTASSVRDVPRLTRVAIDQRADVPASAARPAFPPELNIHPAASVPNCPCVEHFPLIDDVRLETIEIRVGRAVPPDHPGHGLLFDPDALERFSYSQ